jgi:hypothetical protein
LDDFDVDAEGGAAFDDLGAVGAVGPGLGDGRVLCGDLSEQRETGGAVGDVGGGDQDCEGQAEDVGDDAAHAAGDLLGLMPTSA